MTTDSGMDVSPSWQELKEERDALVSKVEARNRLLRQREERINALLAHVERIKAHAGHVGHTNPEESITAKILAEGPTTSLSRLKSQWQAEALSHAAESAPPDAASWLMALSDDYRHQPKEPRS